MAHPSAENGCLCRIRQSKSNGKRIETFEVSRLDSIELIKPNPTNLATLRNALGKVNRFQLQLVDRSLLNVSSLQIKDGNAIAKSATLPAPGTKEPTNNEIRFPSNSIDKLLFNNGSDQQKKLYSSLSFDQQTSDELIILRPNDSLDRISGIVISVSEEAVEFSFEGQTIQAPLAKLYGVHWYRRKIKSN